MMHGKSSHAAKLPKHIKNVIEEDEMAEEKNMPSASACEECGKPHAGIHGKRKGKGYGMKMMEEE